MKLSYKDAVKTIHQEQQALFHHMEEAKRSGYICPYCGNGSGSDGTGINLIKGKGNLFHCHRCGWNGDIIAYIEKSEGLKHIEAVKMLLAELGHELDSGQPDVLPEQHTEATEAPEEPKEDYSKKYPYWHKCALEGTETALYMDSRGISRNTWEKYGIGYCQERNSIIFPVNKHTYIERFIDPKAKYRYQVSKGGSCSIWNGQAVGNDNKVMFITEGILDALSVIECGYDAIAIRSANTAQRAGKMLAQSAHAQQKVFCIITDSDSAGIKAGQDLQDAFTEAGILWRNEILTVVSPCKDANERLLQDPEGQLALSQTFENGAALAMENFIVCGTELAAGSVDAVVIDLPVAKNLMEKNSNFVILDEVLGSERYGICFRNGEEELRDKVEAGIMKLVEDGTYAALGEKYGLDADQLCLLSK